MATVIFECEESEEELYYILYYNTQLNHVNQ